MPSIQLKAAVVAPIPRVRQRIARKEKLGFRRVPAFALKIKNSINEKLFAGPPVDAQLNPYAMIISGQMLLAWLARKRGEPKATAAADRILAAVTKVIAERKHLTRDLGGSASTQQMGDAIAAAV